MAIFLVKRHTVFARVSFRGFLFEKLSPIKKGLFDKHGLAGRSDRL